MIKFKKTLNCFKGLKNIKPRFSKPNSTALLHNYSRPKITEDGTRGAVVVTMLQERVAKSVTLTLTLDLRQ